MVLPNLRALVRRTTFSGAVKQLDVELGMLLIEQNGRNSRLTDGKNSSSQVTSS
jgi:hypothetical protein